MLVSRSNLGRNTMIDFFAFLEYICPKCNHFNASTRSKRSRQKQGASPTSPNASVTSSPKTPTSSTRQKSLPQSPQESDLPNVDRMEVDTEVDASSTWGVRLGYCFYYYILAVYHQFHNDNFPFVGGCFRFRKKSFTQSKM